MAQVLDALGGGADPNQRTNHGTTVLQLAIEFGRPPTNSLEIATTLVQNGADPSVYSLDETDAAMVFYGARSKRLQRLLIEVLAQRQHPTYFAYIPISEGWE